MSTITGTIDHSITLANSGNYTSPLTIAVGGSVANAGTGDAIYGPATSAWTVNNQGQVSATGTYSAINLAGGGEITNSGAVLSAGTFGIASGGTSGAGTLSVFNSGTITETGTASGAFASAVFDSGAGYILNQKDALIAGYQHGVFLGGAITTPSDTVVNYGTILSSATSGFNGAVFLDAGGVVNNKLGALISGGYGVGGGTVTNAGTILGAPGGTGVNAQTVDNSGYIRGEVEISGTMTNSGTVMANGMTGAAAENIGVYNLGTALAFVNQLRGVIEGYDGYKGDGTSGALVNFGTISGATTAKYNIGVLLTEGGSLENHGLIQGGTAVYQSQLFGNTRLGTLVNTGTIAAGGSFFLDPGVLFGSGTIENNGGLIVGHDGVYIEGTLGTVINSGSIGGTAGTGVLLKVGGFVTNQTGGTISGTGFAVDVRGSAGTVFNAGLIGISTASTAIEFDAGGYLYNAGTGSITGGNGLIVRGTAGTVVNHGTINGTVLVLYGGSIANIGGLIDGSNEGAQISGGGSIGNTGSIVATNQGFNSDAVRLNNGGYLHNSGLVSGDHTGVLVLGTSGTITNLGTILARHAGSYQAVYFLNTGGEITNFAGGLIEGNTGVEVNQFQGGLMTIVDAGTISGTGGTAIAFGGTAGTNLLVLEGASYRIAGAVVGGASATNTLELSGTVGNTVTASYNSLGLTNFQDILFGPGGNAMLDVANAGGTLSETFSGLTLSSDVIDLTMIGQNGSIAGLTAGQQLTIAGSLGSVTLKLDGTDASQFDVHSDGTSGTDVVVCFAAGTRILTPSGEVAVENLVIGQRVVTLSGAARPIKWIGRRAYRAPFLARNPDLWPIRIKRGALGGGLPRRDLWVSAKHALFIDGLLLPAEALVNGVSIMPEPVAEIAYCHVELASHDVIFAEGAAAESYVDCDNRGAFHNAAEFTRLHPGEDRQRWRFCAPRIEEGPDLDRIRRRLSRGAAADPLREGQPQRRPSARSA